MKCRRNAHRRARLDACTSARLALLVGAGVALATPPASFSKPLFGATYVAFPASKGCCWLASGDLNGDGLPDLVTANRGCSENPYWGTNTVTVLLNEGDGTYGAPRNFDTGANDTFVAVADVDADGLLDVVVNDLYAEAVSVLRGLGDGTLAVAVPIPTGNTPRSVAIADLDRDGSPDLVVPGSLPQNRGSVTILLGRGGLSFSAPSDLGLTIRPYAVSIEDLDGDGRLDLAVAAATGVSVVLGHGDGTFGPRTEYLRAEGVGVVASADFNRDGRPDLAATGTQRISVLLGVGAGHFASPIVLPLSSSPRHVAAGDLDGDGWPDLVATTPWDLNTVSLFRGVGDGTFLPRSDYYAGRPGTSTLLDADADGMLDVATTHVEMERVSLFTNNGDGSFGMRLQLQTARQPGAVAVADLNRDGRPDLGVACAAESVVSVFLGRGGGGFAARSDYRVGPYLFDLGFGDVDGDGNIDCAVTNLQGLSVSLGRGDGTFSSPALALGMAGRTLALGDVNGDGRHDIVTANEDSNSVAVFLSPTGGLPTERRTWGVGGLPTAVVIGDWNGDGLQDLSTVNSRSTTVSSLLGSPGGHFVRCFDSPTALGGRRQAAADLNGDGRLDLVVACAFGESASVSSLLGEGDGTFRLLGSYATDLDPEDVRIGDLDGDGRLDVVTSNAGPGTISVLLGNGDGSFGARTDYGTGERQPGSYLFRSGMALADVNGDGMLEIALSDESGNAMTVLLNRGRPTPLGVDDLRATWTEAGVLLTWRLSPRGRAEIAAVHVQRASAAEGPYAQTTWSPLAPVESMTFLDEQMASGRQDVLGAGGIRWYRLVLVSSSGAARIVGPVPARIVTGAWTSTLFPPVERQGGAVEIRYRLGEASRSVRLRAFDVRGRLLRSFDRDSQPPGDYGVTWDGRDAQGTILPRGVYLVQLDDGRVRAARKFVLSRQ